MIVGGIEEIRLDEAANELYVADNYLGGARDGLRHRHPRLQTRVGRLRTQRLSEITTNDVDRAYTPGGRMPKEFKGPLTLNSPTTDRSTPPITTSTAFMSSRGTARS
jgi:hypothetical protein